MMLKWWNLMPFILVSAGFLQCTRDHVRVYFLRTKLTKENQMMGCKDIQLPSALRQMVVMMEKPLCSGPRGGQL